MKFFSIGCNETPDTTQTRYGISSIEPLKEGILGGSLRRITKTVIKVVAATLSFFSIGPAHFACSSGSKSYAGSDQSSTQNKSVTKTGKNDKNGKAVFEANGKTYEINLYARETGESVSGVDIIFSIKGEGGFYVVLDSSGVYVPRLAGLGPVMDEKSDSSATKKVSNVVMFKQGGICQLPASLFSTVDLSSEEGMMQLDKWHEELKKDEDAKNPLTENFKKDDEIVTLAELNDKISESLQHVGGDVSARALPAIALYFGFKKVGKAVAGLLNKANLALFVADLCATSEKLDWAGVYYGLCYSDFDKFEIWKFKYTNLEIKPLIQNPFFLVLPAESKQGWSPPVAWISGKVVYESPEEQFFGMFYSEVELKHVDGKLPTIKSETPLFYPGIPETTFSFVASACGNINPTYDIGIPSWGYSDSLHPKTTLTVKDKEEYAVNFYINEDCGTSPLKQYVVSYEDKDKDGFGNKYKIAVSCGEVEGYVENGVDCDDKDIGIFPEKCGQNGDNCNGGFIEGECSKVKLLAKRSSWMSCPAIDLDGNVYLCEFFSDLHSMTPFLQKKWDLKLEGGCAGQPSVSSSGAIYVYDMGDNIYSVNPDGSIIWKLNVENKLQASILYGQLGIASDEMLYALSCSSSSTPDIFSITGTGAISWSKSFGTVTCLSSLILDATRVYAESVSELLALDYSGEVIWNSYTHSGYSGMSTGMSISDDGTLYASSTTGLRVFDQDGNIKWEFADGILEAPPSIDNEGNLYFGVNIAFTEYRFYSLNKDGSLRWTFKADSMGPYQTSDNPPIQPTLSADGSIYFPVRKGVYSLTESGDLNWFVTTDGEIYCPISVSQDGLVYIKSGESMTGNEIYIFEGSSPLINSPWPMSRHDPQNSGNADFPIGGNKDSKQK